MLSLVAVTSCNKVLFLVLDGVTESLLSRNVSTPALDYVRQSGAYFTLTPGHSLNFHPRNVMYKPRHQQQPKDKLTAVVAEFPADTLPTLQSMMTGEHTDMTGVISSEVDQAGEVITQFDRDFWLYDLNLLKCVKELNNVAGKLDRSTGCIRFPGCQFYLNQDKIYTRGLLYQQNKNESQESDEEANRSREKRSVEDLTTIMDPDIEDKKTSSNSEDKEIINNTEEKSSEDSSNHVDVIGPVDTFFINKTSDKEWLGWLEELETAMSWMKGEHPTNLVLFYLDQPAQQIRAFGPDSYQADLALYKVDQFVKQMLQVMKERELLSQVNIVITGLHGYAEMSAEGAFDISNLVKEDDYYAYGTSTNLNIQPVRMDQELDIFASLQKGDMAKFSLYNKHGIPDRFHYKSNNRVTDIMLLAQEGHAFATKFYDEVKILNQRANRQNVLENKYGFAGYDNSLASMQSVLMMTGPDIKVPEAHSEADTTQTPNVQAVDVFPLLVHLLGLSVGSRNGSLQEMRSYLTNPPSHAVQVIQQAIEYIHTQNYLKPETLIGLSTGLLVLLSVCCCWCCCRTKSSDFSKIHNYKYSQVKNNRRRGEEARVDGSEEDDTGDKVGLLTSAIMQAEEEDVFDQIA